MSSKEAREAIYKQVGIESASACQRMAEQAQVKPLTIDTSTGVCTADVTFMGTSDVHKFHFTSDSARASNVAWEHLDYDHTTNAFLLDCTFTHRGKHPQIVELPLPRV